VSEDEVPSAEEVKEQAKRLRKEVDEVRTDLNTFERRLRRRRRPRRTKKIRSTT